MECLPTFLTKDRENNKYQNKTIIYSVLVLGRSVRYDWNGEEDGQQAVYDTRKFAVESNSIKYRTVIIFKL